MVLYARNDINAHHDMSTGHSHSRPRKSDGTRVPIWGIDCPPCERSLSGNPAWSSSRYKIPLTPDEEQEAADAKAAAESAMHQQQLMLAQAAVTNQMAARNAQPDINPDDLVVSSDPEEQPASVKAAATAIMVEQVKADYATLTKTDLKDVCRERNLTVSGTREDLIDRIAESILSGGTP
ncbi:MAG TPA: SAP domain-containing protein [Trebonia sp.]|nr:SAP domain-containing protein [Trebonia sp.]